MKVTPVGVVWIHSLVLWIWRDYLFVCVFCNGYGAIIFLFGSPLTTFPRPSVLSWHNQNVKEELGVNNSTAYTCPEGLFVMTLLKSSYLVFTGVGTTSICTYNGIFLAPYREVVRLGMCIQLLL